MANEYQIHVPHLSGDTLYFTVRNDAGQVRDVVAGAWDSPVKADWGDYDVTLTEQDTDSGTFLGTFPVLAVGIYNVFVQQQSGGSPANTDDVVWTDTIWWDGTDFVTPGDLLTWLGTAPLALDSQRVQTLANELDTQAKADVNAEADTAISDAALATSSALATVDTVVDAILADTGTDGVVLADDAITSAKIAADAITSSELADSAVTEIITALQASGYSVTTSDTTTSTTISRRRGDTWSIALTSLGDISARTKLWFTIKRTEDDADTDAIVMIEETDGLMYLNGSDASARSSNGSITVSDEDAGDLTIALDEVETDDLVPPQGSYRFDIQYLSASGITTIAEGAFRITADITRAVS